jgi:hypothetical protein
MGSYQQPFGKGGMMAHTPGPWGIVFHCDVERIRLNGSTVYQVSDVTDPEFPSGTPRYNLDDLRLMAAAPEMLATLRIAADALDYAQAQVDSENDAHNLRVRLVQVKRVIAKAEGRGE